jgi:hypothetical protein
VFGKGLPTGGRFFRTKNGSSRLVVYDRSYDMQQRLISGDIGDILELTKHKASRPHRKLEAKNDAKGF